MRCFPSAFRVSIPILFLDSILERLLSMLLFKGTKEENKEIKQLFTFMVQIPIHEACYMND